MKKIFLTLIFVPLLMFAKAQTLTSFVQTGIGLNVEQSGYMLFAEYGQMWKWLDVSLSIDYESTFILGKTNSGNVTFYKNGLYNIDGNYYQGSSQFSLMLNARIDIIRFFSANSCHALKVGGGFGYANEQQVESKKFPVGSGLDYNLYVFNRYLWTYSLQASYEFDITSKITLGTFFRGSYTACVGLSIRCNF